MKKYPKGWKKGEKNSNAKITLKIANKIRARWIPYKVTHQMLGDDYGLSASMVRQICSYRYWRNS